MRALRFAGAMLLLPAMAFASSSRIPGEFRPSLVDATARAIWTNPAMMGATDRTSLVVEEAWRENTEGDFDWNDPTYFTIAAASDRAGYGYRRELGDVEGVPDWVVFLTGRSVPRRGFSYGSTVEWRGRKDFDATAGVAMSLGRALKVGVAVEDLFETHIDGTETARVWRGGASLQPAGGRGYLAWDFVRSEADGDDGAHWFSVGFGSDRIRVAASTDTDGNWTGRISLGASGVFVSGALTHPDAGPQEAFGSLDVERAPQTRDVR
jgi:hypothetical protein